MLGSRIRHGALALALTGAITAGSIGPAPRAGARPARHLVVAPPAGAPFSDQIGGAFTPAPDVAIVDRDRSERPAPGRYGICYVNAFQAQTDQARWWRRRHPEQLLVRDGHEIVDRGWNEPLLDTSTAARRQALARIETRWLAGCARAGYRAVEPDNLDSWQRSQGTLTERDNLAFAAILISTAHRFGLAIAQKNAAEISARGRRLGFDFAIAEECEVYSECGSYTAAYGREVIEIEYADNGGQANFMRACHDRGQLISIVLRDRDVTPAGQAGFLEKRCPPA